MVKVLTSHCQVLSHSQVENPFNVSNSWLKREGQTIIDGRELSLVLANLVVVNKEPEGELYF